MLPSTPDAESMLATNSARTAMLKIDEALTAIRHAILHANHAGLDITATTDPFDGDKARHDKVTHHLSAAMIHALDLYLTTLSKAQVA